MNGHFSLSRTLLNHEIWLNEKFTRGQAWVDLIGLANWKDGYIRVRGKRIEIPRGSIGWSKQKIYKRWGWSEGKYTKFIKELQKDGMISLKTINHFFIVISIQNYDKRQSIGNQMINQIGNQMINQMMYIKEENKDNKENNNNKRDFSFFSESQEKIAKVNTSSFKNQEPVAFSQEYSLSQIYDMATPTLEYLPLLKKLSIDYEFHCESALCDQIFKIYKWLDDKGSEKVGINFIKAWLSKTKDYEKKGKLLTEDDMDDDDVDFSHINKYNYWSRLTVRKGKSHRYMVCHYFTEKEYEELNKE